MTALPAWCASPEARALLAAIIEERPDAAWLRARDMFPRSYPRYISKNVGALRRLHDRLCEEALAACDASGEYSAAVAGLYRNEPDDLVHRLLQESEGLVEVERKDLGDGLHRVAA